MNPSGTLTYPQLTSTRFVAAFLVIVYHFGILPRRVIPFHWFDQIHFFNLAGGSAVYYFFVLSGFVLTAAYHGRPLHYGLFIANRLGRIYPVYFVALCLTLLVTSLPLELVSGLLHTPSIDATKQLVKVALLSAKTLNKRDLCLSVFLLQGWHVTTWQVFNGPGWSLSVEFFLYLLFPFLLPLVRRKTETYRLVFLIAGIAGSIACPLLLASPLVDSSRGFLFIGSPLLALPGFLLGMVAYEFGLRNRLPAGSLVPAFVFLGSVGCCVLLLSVFVFEASDFLLNPFFALIIWSLSQDTSLIARTLAHPKLVLLGEISYGYYILQLPVFLIASQWLHLFDGLTDTAFFYLFNSLLLLVAWGSFRGLETPVRRFVKTITARIDHRLTALKQRDLPLQESA
ncbi:acyltransferase family protein [Fibrella sp. WM1]|uniref:acyltransferase family protein n=1 Tax=Fibrella musci TaxID=3242485 RepID=UPI0035215A33